MQEFFENKAIKTVNKRLCKLIQEYSLFCILHEDDLENQKQKLLQNVNGSSLIIIKYYENSKLMQSNDYFIFGFQKTLIFINNDKIESLLQNIYLENPEISICFLSDSKNFLNKNIIIKNHQLIPSRRFENEVLNFNNAFNLEIPKNPELVKIWKNICSCVTGYLINECYNKIAKDRISDFFDNQNYKLKPKNFNNDDFVEIGIIDSGSVFKAVLMYQIDDKKLCIIKKPHSYDDEITKLTKREKNNYSDLAHPFIPLFIGEIKDKDVTYPVVEYINGTTLFNINKLHLYEIEKYKIILQLLSVFHYLHNKGFIYRDLKPNNLIIDQNKTLVLIDFDRMIKSINNESSNFANDQVNLTNDFAHDFKAPELNSGNVTNKCDIYSIGKIIYYIINENLKDDIESKANAADDNTSIYKIVNKCININPDERPSIHEIILDFYDLVIYKGFILDCIHPDDQIQIGLILLKKYCDVNKSIQYFQNAAKINHPSALNSLGIIYSNEKYGVQDINKAIHFFKLAANFKNSEALFNLGLIYYEGKYIVRDINKAIYYFSLASNLNSYQAQIYLGVIYSDEKYVQRDIEKSIHFFQLAADQNIPSAQFNLGIIYYEGKIVQRDINKTIHYFTLAANQNHKKAQLNLGLIYSDGKYIKQDIAKSIHYFTLAAKQNDLKTQFNLGMIYYENKIIPRDIGKSIYFFKLAANQNYSHAQYNLGVIYYENRFIERDIEKAIHYFTLAANQNHSNAQIKLGVIFFDNKFVLRDINKSIYYFSLAANQKEQYAQIILGLFYYKGEFIKQDINKFIKYFTLAANQNNCIAQYFLGLVYYEGQHVTRDINKSIHFLSMSANQNYQPAQNKLGVIYYENLYIKRDVRKSIHYFTSAANLNHPRAQFNLGIIYYEGQFVQKNINKSIHYFSLAASQGDSYAQYILGYIYFNGESVQKDIEKSIFYYTQAANQNESYSQFDLGLIYYEGISVPKNMNKGISYLTFSSNNGNVQAHFCLGFLYHEGKNVMRDIKKSIRLYKEASSFNNQYAKNNLGIIYQSGFEKEIERNIDAAKIYFNESIKQKNDPVSMYNLAHLYIYNELTNETIDISIELLIKSFEKGFVQSLELLCIVLILKIKISLLNDEKIKSEIQKYSSNSNLLFCDIKKFIQINDLYDQNNFDVELKTMENINFLYNEIMKPITAKSLNFIDVNKVYEKGNQINITIDFYDGFGYDILN